MEKTLWRPAVHLDKRADVVYACVHVRSSVYGRMQTNIATKVPS